jgi:hypothetical protein
MKARTVVALAAVALSFAGATGSQAQTGAVHVGPRVTYNFDFEEAAIGFQLGLPLASRLDFYPSVDIFLPDQGSLAAFNADLRFRPQDMGPWYLGTGLNLTRASAGGESNTDAGLNLIAGLEAQTGVIHPFVEVRGILSDRNSMQLTGGLNITIGRR